MEAHAHHEETEPVVVVGDAVEYTVHTAHATHEQIPLVVRGEETTSWTPDEETINFDPAVLGPGDGTLPPIVGSDTQKLEMYLQTKRLASYIGRMELTGHDVKSVARSIWLNVRRQFDSGSRTLQALSSQLSPYAAGVEPNLYTCFYLYIRILVHDILKGNPRHKCVRDECQMFCILPVYARRCLSDTQIEQLMHRIRYIFEHNESLLVSNGRTTESKTALNIFRHLVLLDDPSLYPTYNVLLAMIGHKETILNSRAKIDSKLYALIFDMIRKNDYERYEEDSVVSSPSIDDWEKIVSWPWMDASESRSFQEEFRSALEQHVSRSIENPDVMPISTTTAPRTGASLTEPSAPPAYESVVIIPQPLPTETDDGLPTYEQVLNEIVND